MGVDRSTPRRQSPILSSKIHRAPSANEGGRSTNSNRSTTVVKKIVKPLGTHLPPFSPPRTFNKKIAEDEESSARRPIVKVIPGKSDAPKAHSATGNSGKQKK